jgi:hypothetical protein
MSCIWNLFRKKNNPSITDLRIRNPLNLDEVPDDIHMLRAIEATLIDNLISIHYILEQSKENVKYLIQKGYTQRLQDAIAQRTVAMERKRVLESRLQRIQARLAEMKAND